MQATQCVYSSFIWILILVIPGEKECVHIQVGLNRCDGHDTVNKKKLVWFCKIAVLI